MAVSYNAVRQQGSGIELQVVEGQGVKRGAMILVGDNEFVEIW